MKGVVEDAMYVSQGGLSMYGRDAEYQWICAWCLSLSHVLINHYEPRITHSEAFLQIY